METKFGFNQVSQTTPTWAKWMFRIAFMLSNIAMMIISGDPVISDHNKVRINLYLSGASMAVFGLSKMFGINVKENDESAT